MRSRSAKGANTHHRHHPVKQTQKNFVASEIADLNDILLRG